jgi:hypothetical protein
MRINGWYVALLFNYTYLFIFNRYIFFRNNNNNNNNNKMWKFKNSLDSPIALLFFIFYFILKDVKLKGNETWDINVTNF